MDGRSLTLQRADETTIPYVESLLKENDLPTADVREKSDCFYVGYDGRNRVGVGGVERYGTAGLLRSLVVEQSFRANGFGTAMCEELEHKARTSGIETVYLLTTTASEFFAARGYTPVERSEPPTKIRQSTQFADLCPTTATCMEKPL